MWKTGVGAGPQQVETMHNRSIQTEDGELTRQSPELARSGPRARERSVLMRSHDGRAVIASYTAACPDTTLITPHTHTRSG